MVEVFRQRFGNQVAILHSRLSQGEKYDEYRRIKRQEVKVVVGREICRFCAFRRILVMIILDEEHDASYKQEAKPRYLTSQIAKMRAQDASCQCGFGKCNSFSWKAMPRALKGVYDLYELPERINQKPLPTSRNSD